MLAIAEPSFVYSMNSTTAPSAVWKNPTTAIPASNGSSRTFMPLAASAMLSTR